MPKTTEKILISPSIIAGDLSTMGKDMEGFDPAVVDLIHLDVMDGHFVPNITYGPGYIAHVQKHTSIPLDIHLMIEKPELSIESYAALKPWCLTIHYESTRFPARLLTLIRDRGIKSGLSLNPATPVESISDLLPYCDLVLIMSVDPGFYGQSFMEESVGRIKKLAEIASQKGLKELRIQVDGGIGTDNIARVVGAGASVIVAGNSAFKGGDVNKNVLALKQAAHS